MQILKFDEKKYFIKFMSVFTEYYFTLSYKITLILVNG